MTVPRLSDRAVVAEPQLGADPGPEVHLRVALRQFGDLLRLAEVADEHPPQRQPGSAQPLHPLRGLGQRVDALGPVHRQVHREALDRDVVDGRPQLGQVLGVDPVPPHAGHALDDHPAADQAAHALDAADGADHPLRQRHRVLADPVRGQHDQVACRTSP